MRLRLLLIGWAGLLVVAQAEAQPATAEGFAVSYTAGQRDGAGRFMGGTELRNLLGHRGTLYAGNGYWMDRPGSEGRQPAQLLRLDEPTGSWRVERNFDELRANRSYRHLAVSALLGATFANGVSLMLVGTWDLSRFSDVFVRNDSTGAWSAVPLPVQRVGPASSRCAP